jgi:hypothetical protein
MFFGHCVVVVNFMNDALMHGVVFMRIF